MVMVALFYRYIRKLSFRESGMTLLEALVALGILSAIAVTFMTGLATSSKSVIIADERSTAENLARVHMEWVKNSDYSDNATTYTGAPIPNTDDYNNYSATISAEALNTPDDGIQKITVTILRSGDSVLTLEGYKVNR